MVVLSLDRLLELCRRYVSSQALETFVVVPVDLVKCCVAQVVNDFPAAWMLGAAGKFRRAVAVNYFSQGTIKTGLDGGASPM